MTYRWMILALVGLMGLSACSGGGQATPVLHGAIFDPPRALTDFSLTSTTGQPFTLSEHRGELILLYFGYRTCPDFCPTTSIELRNLYQELGKSAERVKVVFVTVDPERDDLESLTRYIGAFHQAFIGLRAEGASLQSLMGQFGVIAERRPLGDDPQSYLVDHTASIFLIGADGRLQAQYLYGTDYQDILSDLKIILKATPRTN